MYLRSHRNCGDLRRHHESRRRADLRSHAQLEAPTDLLRLRHPGGPGPRNGHGAVSLAGSGAHAGKAGPDQGQIRTLSVSSDD